MKICVTLLMVGLCTLASAKTLRDPTQPPGAVGYFSRVRSQDNDIGLQGIYYSKKQSKVMINGQTVGVGDNINGITIKKIYPDRVVIEGSRGVAVATMHYPDVRTPSGKD